jgi:S-DNA-T family DNA segregation ATPase FtsK/SpoIIIE
VLLINLVLRTSVSVVEIARSAVLSCLRGVTGLYTRMVEALAALSTAWREAKAIEMAERAQREAAERPRITVAGVTAPGIEDAAREAPSTGEHDADDDEADDDGDDALHAVAAGDDDEDAAPARAPIKTTTASGRTGAPAAARSVTGSQPAPKPSKRGPVIVAPRQETPKKSRDAGFATSTSADGRTFMLPPTTLLTEPENQALQIDEQQLKENALRLVDKLAAYGVRGRVDEIHPGPIVTMYEFEPQSGTKVSKIASLSDDLAMALAAEKVRIVAPIPGKARGSPQPD